MTTIDNGWKALPHSKAVCVSDSQVPGEGKAMNICCLHTLIVWLLESAWLATL